jgi:hypothetical protein
VSASRLFSKSKTFKPKTRTNKKLEMKIFIVALALVAVTFAEEEASNLRGRLEYHRANRAEWVEKFKAMPEEERHEKIREVHDRVRNSPKFESMSPERRQEILDKIHRKFPEGAQAYGVQEIGPVPASSHNLTDEEKKVMRENIRKMTPEQREEIRRNLGDRSRHPRPAVTGDFQKPRDVLDDIMVGKINMQ